MFIHTHKRAHKPIQFFIPFIHFSLSILFPPPPHPYFLGSCSYFQTLFAAPKHNHIYITNVSWGAFFCVLQREHAIGLLSLSLSSVDCWVHWTLYTSDYHYNYIYPSFSLSKRQKTLMFLFLSAATCFPSPPAPFFLIKMLGRDEEELREQMPG